VDFSTVPITGVVLLVATTVLRPADVWDALRGDERLRPYEIIVLFFALAYMSISIDQTGVFDYLAVKSVNATNGNGKLLFVVFFSLSSIITIVTSNDIVILTITPIICALAKLAAIDPKPMLFAQCVTRHLPSSLCSDPHHVVPHTDSLLQTCGP
jgi:Na+/H+ antiporter NhaD/arsenite permease-like protein